jgi:hypothetical protein
MAMEFDPFNEYRLATAGEEGGIKLWKIPEENLTANIETPQAHIRMRDVAHVRTTYHIAVHYYYYYYWEQGAGCHWLAFVALVS